MLAGSSLLPTFADSRGRQIQILEYKRYMISYIRSTRYSVPRQEFICLIPPIQASCSHWAPSVGSRPFAALVFSAWSRPAIYSTMAGKPESVSSECLSFCHGPLVLVSRCASFVLVASKPMSTWSTLQTKKVAPLSPNSEG